MDYFNPSEFGSIAFHADFFKVNGFTLFLARRTITVFACIIKVTGRTPVMNYFYGIFLRRTNYIDQANQGSQQCAYDKGF